MKLHTNFFGEIVKPIATPNINQMPKEKLEELKALNNPYINQYLSKGAKTSDSKNITSKVNHVQIKNENKLINNEKSEEKHMEKNKVVDGLIKDLRKEKEEARKLHTQGDKEAYKQAIDKIKKSESTLTNMLECLDENTNVKSEAFINVLKVESGVKTVSVTDQLIMNYMKESSGADGGFLVPDEIQTDVKRLRHDGTDLESLVNVESISRNKGKRTIELRADNTPLELVEEYGVIPEIDEPNLTDVSYQVQKRAGIITVTNELFEDSNPVILKWLKTWLAKKSRATRNKAIIDKVNEITLGKEVNVTTVKDLKVIFNKTLDTYNNSSIVLTNSTGYNFLDNLTDDKGNPVLESDIANKRKLLFGLYPVVRVSDILLPNEGVNPPIICGDLKEAITLFDRELLSVDISKNGATFFTDQTKIKVRDRFDVKEVDVEAVVKVIGV